MLAPSLSVAATAVIGGASITFAVVGEGFDRPVGLLPRPGDGRLLVVEKNGKVKFLADGRPGQVFLDFRRAVSHNNEQGLLGMVFDPKYATTGKLYVNYTDKRGDTQVSSLTAVGDAVDGGSARTVLSIDQPEDNHNGGWIAFGPDGFLYIGTGDGGGEGDQHGQTGNAQNSNSLLGKILRIDVESAEPYGIPPSNPFARGGGAPEVFAMGLRNPWRDAFDGNTLYIADVGQESREEIDVISISNAGANLGWRAMEGRDCYPSDRRCTTGGFVMPIYDYGHEIGCSVTGGLVYRGGSLPALNGRYFFADYCSGAVESFRYVDGAVTDHVTFADTLGSLGNITSFGNDAEGELYVVTDDGRVLKMVAAK